MSREKMAKAMLVAITGLLLVGAGAQDGSFGPVDPVRLDRARYNYEAVRDGRRQIAQLSAQELEDVAALDLALREQKAEPRTTSQRCVDRELRQLNGPPSTLTQRVIDMKCREAGEGLGR